MRKSLLLLILFFTNNIFANYVSVLTGEEVEINHWILLDQIVTKDDKGDIYNHVYKYCSITNIVDETKMKQNTYGKKINESPINAYGYVWFIINNIPVQSFTAQNIFQDVLTGRRNLTLPETCEIELEEFDLE